MSSSASDIRDALRKRTDPAQPFVTYLGEDGRVELSGASVTNAAAKIANVLAMEFDLSPGARVGVHLPWHWQRVTWLIGIWCAGCTAVPQGGQDCDLVVAGPSQAQGLSGPVQVVSTHPFGMPLDAATVTQLRQGVEDVTIAVRAQPDEQIVVENHRDQIALDGRTQEQVLSQARSFADGLQGIRRLGVIPNDKQWWLPALWPLVTDGSVVMSHGPIDSSEPVDAIV